jgi:hypothetical protein
VAPPSRRCSSNPIGSIRPVRHWNEIAINATGLDHTPVAPGETRVFSEELGPGRSSRAMAIVHIAIFDAVNAIAGRYTSYTDQPPARQGASVRAAIAAAAHDTLVALFPSQTSLMDEALAADLRTLPNGRAMVDGLDVGRRAAAAILALRSDDGSQQPEPHVGVDFLTSNDPGKWRQDPIGRSPLALGARWGAVRPFVLQSGDQFRVPPPPALDSADYAAAFDEVKRLGRRRRRHFDRAYGGGIRDRRLLGLRRDAEPLRATAPLQSDHDGDRRADGHRPRRPDAPPRAGQRRDGGRRHCRVGLEVPLPVLEARHRHP